MHTPEPFDSVDFCRGVARYSPHTGPWRLFTLPLSGNSTSLARRAEMLDCDGAILMPGMRLLLERLAARGLKLVDVDGENPPGRFAAIRLDDEHIGRVGARHLLERGFTSLAVLGVDRVWSRGRARGFAAEAAASGAAVRRFMARSWTELHTWRWINGRLDALARPVGIFCSHDRLAARVIEACIFRGWQVATHVAVLGVDDRFLECTSLPVPLSSVSVERFRAGVDAARMLDRLLAGQSVPRGPQWIRTNVVVERQSTSAHAYADADVVAALALVRSGACEGLTADHVASRLNLSRSTLDRRFRAAVGRLPGEEIRRVKFDRVRRLLEQTRMPLAEIAAACGFASISSLSHCFRHELGVSPTQYRARSGAMSYARAE
jgi:LacI family transcriptional regulator